MRVYIAHNANNMNKAELINTIYLKVDEKYTKKQIHEILEAERDAIVEAVAEGDKVRIVGFGSYAKRERKARLGRNPKTGEAMEISAATRPHFTPGKEFVDAVS